MGLDERVLGGLMPGPHTHSPGFAGGSLCRGPTREDIHCCSTPGRSLGLLEGNRQTI